VDGSNTIETLSFARCWPAPAASTHDGHTTRHRPHNDSDIEQQDVALTVTTPHHTTGAEVNRRRDVMTSTAGDAEQLAQLLIDIDAATNRGRSHTADDTTRERGATESADDVRVTLRRSTSHLMSLLTRT
jgi:hypothetical protein